MHDVPALNLACSSASLCATYPT